eukprot:scaffold1307_cov166-Ochromonas_danica.AAC.42
MGKRKLPGTKNVDKVPKLAKEEEERANETRRHVTFDEDADIETPSTDLILDGKKMSKKDKKRKQQEQEEEEEASPEEITADSMQVQQLKDLYEQSLLSTKKKNKKKKAAAKRVEQEQQEEEEELDAALLDSLQTVGGDEDNKEKEEDAEGEGGSSSRKTSFREEEEDLTKSKTIGRVKIIALEEKKINPLDHFKLSPEIAAFEQKRREGGAEGVERVRYTTFIAQRRPGPAKRFLRS